MLTSYKTLAQNAQITGEFIDRRSRFIAHLRHVKSEKEAQLFLDEVRSLHHDARHNVPAWILADGRERCSDDGEPQRTSGIPSLEVLRAAGLADVCVVTTRYFGGILLGPGGLVRAYTAAVQEALRQAEDANLIVIMTLVTRVTCVVSYSAYGMVQHLVGQCGGKITDTIFSDDVQLSCLFQSGEEHKFVAKMCELHGGEDVCIVGEPHFGEF